jgi:hypothetical protein
MVLCLVNLCIRITDDAMQKIRAEVDTSDAVDWQKVETEVYFFSLFCLDYWLSEYSGASFSKGEVRHALYNFFKQAHEDDSNGGEVRTSLHECLQTYAGVISEEASDTCKLSISLYRLFAERAGLSPSLHLMILVPDIFFEIMQVIYRVGRSTGNGRAEG